MKKVILALLLAAGLTVSATPAHAAQAQQVESWPIASLGYCAHHTLTAVNLGATQNVSVSAETYKGGFCGEVLKLPKAWITTQYRVECGVRALDLISWRVAFTSTVKANAANTNKAVLSKNGARWCKPSEPLRVTQTSGFLLIDGWHTYSQQTVALTG